MVHRDTCRRDSHWNSTSRWDCHCTAASYRDCHCTTASYRDASDANCHNTWAHYRDGEGVLPAVDNEVLPALLGGDIDFGDDPDYNPDLNESEFIVG